MKIIFKNPSRLIIVGLFSLIPMTRAWALSLRDLGRGINPEQGQLLDHCLIFDLDKDASFSPSPEQHISFEQILNFNSSNSILSTSGSVGIDLGLVSGQAELDITTKVTSDETTISLLYAYRSISGTLSLDSFKADPDLGMNCGTAFIQQIRFGHALFFNIKIHFLSQEHMRRVTARIKVSALFGLITKTETFTDETRELTKDLRYSIYAYQLGGDDSKLNELANSSFCRLDASSCFQTFTSLMAYAKSEFTDQIQSNPNGYQSMYAMQIAQESYESIGLDQLKDPETADTLDKRARLLSAIDRLSDLLDRMDYLQSLGRIDGDSIDARNLRTQFNVKSKEYKGISELCVDPQDHSDCQDLLTRDFEREVSDLENILQIISNR